VASADEDARRRALAPGSRVARFFCTNTVSVETIDDLCDYLADCRRRDRS
jgi:hypothetical protein